MMCLSTVSVFQDRIVGAIPDPNGFQVNTGLFCSTPSTLINSMCGMSPVSLTYSNISRLLFRCFIVVFFN